MAFLIMGLEIERKFLVKNNSFILEAEDSFRITQAYLNSDPERVVRIRRKGEKAFLTIKGKSNKSGLSRFEWEKEIAIEEFESLLDLCEQGIIDKTRYIIPSENHKYEVDVFHAENDGLVIAEIELGSEDEDFTKASFLANEVTGDIKYYNSYLTKKPYSKW